MNEADKRNPYKDTNDQPLLRLSVVAFVDILGYSEMVKEAERQGKSYDFLVRIRDAINNGLEWLLPEFVAGGYDKDLYRVKVFTDNIVIGYPIFHDAEAELGHVFNNLGYFQLEMVNHGFFIRGGLSIGELFMDDNIVYGPGLIEAYQAEADLARDPRIVLADTAAKAVKEHLTYYASVESSPQSRDLLIDTDGKYFINYLDSILIAEDEIGPEYEELLKHKNIIEECLIKYLSRPPLWTKYAWTANYHNYFCGLYTYFSDEHKIDMSQYQMTPKLIK